jgi:hypothetical protein
MDNLTFFKDKKQTIKCNISVEGSSLSKTKSRLILEFPDKILLYRGTIDEYGECIIEVPPLGDVKELSGDVILEVITDGYLFEPMKSNFSVKQSRIVEVKNVKMDSVETKEAPDVIIENIKEETKPVIPKIVKTSIPIPKKSFMQRKIPKAMWEKFEK